MARKPETTKTPDNRDENTDAPVTELATVDGTESPETLRQMSGISDTPYKPAENNDKEPSQQQRDAFDGLKKARDEAKHPEKRDEPQPFYAGPGGMVA